MKKSWHPLILALSVFLMVSGALIFLYKKFVCCGGDETIVRTRIGTLQAHLMQYTAKYRRLPTTSEGLEALFTAGIADDRDLLEDRWGHPVRYRNPGTRSGDAFDVYSTGKDGVDGTADDIGNWEDRPAG